MVVLGDILILRGLLTEASFDRVRRLETESGERLDHIAAKLGLVADGDLATVYAELLGSDILSDQDFPTSPIVMDRLLPGFLHEHRVIPIAETEATLIVAMADPLDTLTLRALAFAIGKEVEPRAALPAIIEAAYERLYGEDRSLLARITSAGNAERQRNDRS